VSTQLWQLSATDLAARIKRREVSAREAALDALARLDAVNPAINAIVECRPEEALKQADHVDAALARGEDPGILAGVPVTTKDMSDQAGYLMTNGLVALKDLVASESTPSVDNLIKAGAVVIGRSNNPTMCLRWFTDNKVYGATFNPHNPALTPGGSSGGAAAALACGIGQIAQGTDIGGSIRYPAYACGVHGLRPSLGRIPDFNLTHGDPPLAIQIMGVSGPLARTIADVRLALAAMSAADHRDPWWVPAPLNGPPAPRKVALCTHPEGLPTDPLLVNALNEAAGRLRQAGWQVDELNQLPPLKSAAEVQALWLIDGADELLDIATADGDPGAINILTRERAAAGEMDLAKVSELLTRRGALIRQWAAFFQDYPVLLVPMSAELPFPDHLDLQGDRGYRRVWDSQLTQLAFPALGVPCLSVAMGTVQGPLGVAPIGVQLVAGRFREDLCLAAGEVIEAAGPMPSVIAPSAVKPR